MPKLTNLILIRDGNRILFAMKKRGFGAGRWNGFGGKVQPGETMEEAAVRETQEEGGITPKDVRRFAVLEFRFEGDPQDAQAIDCHCFTTNAWDGEPVETEEMAPRWFSVDEIPFDDMWPDDRHWFPLFLAGKTFEGSFLFSQDQKTILHQEIIER